MGMLDTLQFVKNIFWECSDNFQYMGLGVGALVYLYVTLEKDPWSKRLVSFSMLFFFLFVFPPFILLARYVLKDSNVYRLLWVLPFVFLIPYAAILFGSSLRGRKEKLFWAGICVVLVLLAGDGFSEREFSVQEEYSNIYHITEEQLRVCEILGIAGEDALVLGADLDVIRAIRRVNPYTKVIYGTDIEYADYEEDVVRLFAYMQDDVIPVEYVLGSAEEMGVNFLVWNKWSDCTVPIGTYLGEDLRLIGETDNYWIFMVISA